MLAVLCKDLDDFVVIPDRSLVIRSTSQSQGHDSPDGSASDVVEHLVGLFLDLLAENIDDRGRHQSSHASSVDRQSHPPKVHRTVDLEPVQLVHELRLGLQNRDIRILPLLLELGVELLLNLQNHLSGLLLLLECQVVQVQRFQVLDLILLEVLDVDLSQRRVLANRVIEHLQVLVKGSHLLELDHQRLQVLVLNDQANHQLVCLQVGDRDM